MRMSIVLDDELVEEGLALTGLRTRRELVTRRKARDLTELAGRVRLREGFARERARKLRDGRG